MKDIIDNKLRNKNQFFLCQQGCRFVLGGASWLDRYWSMGGARPRPSTSHQRGFKKQTTKACLEFLKNQAFVFQVFENRPSSHRFRRSFAPEWQHKDDQIEKEVRRAKDRQMERYNASTRPLAPFQVGDHVLIQHPVTKCWATPGIIVECGPNRNYLVKSAAGLLFRRNRRFLRRRVPIMSGSAEPATPAPGPAAAVTTGTRARGRPRGRQANQQGIPTRRSSRTRLPVNRFQAGQQQCSRQQCFIV